MKNPKQMVYKPDERTILLKSTVVNVTDVSRGVLGRFSQAGLVQEHHTFLQTDITVKESVGRKPLCDGYEVVLLVSSPKWINLHFIGEDGAEVTIQSNGLYQTCGAFTGRIEVSTNEPDDESIRCSIIRA